MGGAEMNKSILLAFALAALFTVSAVAEEHMAVVDSGVVDDPNALSPEEFFDQDLTVYSPAKKLQKLKNIPAAVYVLTSDEIRRSGAEHLIDVFRLIPGIEVARVSAHEWAITSRGFNQVFGNKIMMLIDGAPVETPLFNGVLWENINIPLDTIERIEVIRGPGATIWGTRAMNGLINVITKKAFTFPHHKAAVGVGNEYRASVYARTGHVISENSAVQVYAKLDRFDDSAGLDGQRLEDSWGIFTGNLRGDFKEDENTLRITANFSSRKADTRVDLPSLSPPFSDPVTGQRENDRAALNLFWERELSKDSQLTLEFNNVYERRKDFLLDLSAFYTEFEMRHRFKPASAHDFTYGANFRFYTDETKSSETLGFDPANRSLEFYRGFLSDDISLISETLTLTIGSRFEQNNQVGFNLMPTAKLLWNVTDKLSLWTAASYTTGNPARVYDDVRLNVSAFPEPTTGLPALVQLIGNNRIRPEKLTAYEIGAWAEPLEKLYASFSTFFFKYKDLVYSSPGEPRLAGETPFLLIPVTYDNDLSADSFGTEVTADWAVTNWFGFAASYSHLIINARTDANQNVGLVEDNPQNMLSLRSHFTIDPSFEIDAILRHVQVDKASQSAFNTYTQADLRLGWIASKHWELELIGRNLLDTRHREANPLIFNSPISTVQRSVFMRVSYTF